MVLKRSELLMIRRGRRWFKTFTEPKLKSGQVVRLRASRRDEGFEITVTEILEEEDGFKVRFTPGNAHPDEVFLAAGWPDYTTDPFRAMRGEPPPMPETMQDRKSRTAWLALALRHVAEPPSAPRKAAGSVTRSERVVYEAGSPEAISVVRRCAK